MKYRSAVLLFLLLFLYSVALASAQETAPAEHLDQLVGSALANNPELKSSVARWEMFRNRIKQAGSFEDPMLMLKIQNGIVEDPLNFSRDGMTQKVIGISQQIPYFGKRKLKEEVASREAEANFWSVEERKLELTRMVKETYYQIFFTDRSLEIVDRNIKLMDDFITIAQTKYSVGQGTQQDIYKAQVERSRMLDMRITLEQQRRSQEITLNSLLYRPSSTKVGAIADFPMSQQPLTAEELGKIAQENRPLLKSLHAQIEKGRAGHELARKEWYPDFNVSFEYMQRDRAPGSDGSDMYSLGVTFNLPVHKARREAMAAESNSEVTMAQEELNATRNTITTGIADLLAQMERRRKLVELYKSGIIPQAEQSLESAVISYRVNKVDFLSLLDSRVTLFNYEREYYDSMADYQMKLAQLEALIGKTLQ
ncbi:MAG TPA: TolC family protein [Geomonas sp.]|nr:TolC family protein [Geomonas sp.]